ncbi:MAG: succinate dehydrogenase [Gemmatimonadales bacterium]|nr:MAG: succinate dehydrogenase [Gemmatimonadales bacterium]
MRRVLSLFDSTVGKKAVMAVSGLILFGFVFAHMAGNLKAFEGQESFDAYAQFLRDLGYPALPEYGVLWIARIVLLLAVAVHIIAAIQLWSRSRKARGSRYRKSDSQVFSYASRTMRWGGVIVALFVVYHLLHLTTGTVHPDFEYGSVYANLVVAFQSVPVVLFYVVAVGALSLHLYHGLWSVFSTLGVQNPKIDRIRRPLAGGVAFVLFAGYVAVPLGVLSGIISL